MSEILIPKKEIWTPPRVKVDVHNHFLAEVFDRKSGKKVMEAEAENVVLNRARIAIDSAGSTGMAQNGFQQLDFMGGCQVGVGTTAPASTDMNLAALRAEAGYATSNQVENPVVTSTAPGNWWHRRKYYFSELVANYGLTEVGLAWGSSSNNATVGPGDSRNSTSPYGALRSRALFRDANGNPITVTKNDTQIMVITATVYLTRGGVDSGMALVDNFFAKSIQNLIGFYSDWYLGDGTTPPANTDTGLAGALLARKSDPDQAYLNARNRVFWDPNMNAGAGGWFYPSGSTIETYRPTGKHYVMSFSQDWNLLEGNVTFSEVLVRSVTSNSFTGSAADTIARIVFPAGTVLDPTYTKTDQVKLRQYFEVIW